MSGLLRRINAWCFPGQQFSPERWAEVRAKGRGQFVLRQSIAFAVIAIGLTDFVSNIVDGAHAFSFGFYIAKYWMIGISIGYGAWGKRESEYKKALLNSSPPGSHLQPH